MHGIRNNSTVSVPENSPVSVILHDDDRKRRPKIAIISSFVPSNQGATLHRVADLDHIITKACYAYIWGYDFIFNTTSGFDQSLISDQGKYWLSYGTWSRVPHVRDRLDDYDWILYCDTDIVMNDLTRPIESFFADWKFHNMSPSLLVPKDERNTYFTFSAFVFLIKNDQFGKSLLDNWMDFALGLCENGNFSPIARNYTWEDSDQPGLWYAIRKTHTDSNPQFADILDKPTCSNQGLINTERAYGPELNKHCRKSGMKLGSFGDDLDIVPNDQPILWSLPPESDVRPGIGDFGSQIKFRIDEPDGNDAAKFSFAYHQFREN